MNNIHEIFRKQRLNRWNTAKSSARERIAKLERIRDAIFAKREELRQAIYNDYRKNPAETDITEIFPTVADINHTIKHLKKWMKPKKVGTPLVLFGTRGEVRYEAKGVVLVIAPWNYPFQLFMVPIATAIASGNCVMSRASSKTPHTAKFLKKFISDLFDESEVAVIEGDRTVADSLLELPFDHIFFTGSPPIGKKVMGAAAKHLASVTLELGGKSPVIVDETANIKKVAERLMWGKFLNAGQTCVAPDHLLIHESKLSEFLERAKKVIAKRFGETEAEKEKSPNFCRLVSEGALQGIKKMLDESVKQGAKIEIGGEVNSNGRYMSPTLLTGVTDNSPIMKEEIFGPVLPIMTFKSLDEAIRSVHTREKPLALYIFSKNKNNIEKIIKSTTAGGTCVNSLIIHLVNMNLPFGGIGQSGMGNYHGFFGFRNLSHERAVLHQGLNDPLKFFYPPYTKRVKKMIDLAMKYFV